MNTILKKAKPKEKEEVRKEMPESEFPNVYELLVVGEKVHMTSRLGFIYEGTYKGSTKQGFYYLSNVRIVLKEYIYETPWILVLKQSILHMHASPTSIISRNDKEILAVTNELKK